MSKKKTITWLTLILFIGLFLRLIAIFYRGPFRFDEIFTIHFSSMHLQKWGWVFYETNPPFFYFLIHFWTKFFGKNEIINRVPAVIFGLFSIFLFIILVKKYFQKKSVWLLRC